MSPESMIRQQVYATADWANDVLRQVPAERRFKDGRCEFFGLTTEEYEELRKRVAGHGKLRIVHVQDGWKALQIAEGLDNPWDYTTLFKVV